MRNTLLFCLLFIFFGCKESFLTDDDLAKMVEPSGLKVYSESKILENGGAFIIEKQLKQIHGNEYYFNNGFDLEYLIFAICPLDCNETIDLKKWDNTTNTFSFLIKNSTRFQTKNRLILYKIVNDKPVKLLDTVKDVYKTFRFEGNKFVYVLEDGTEKTIGLM